ncbi:hypothetical protein [Achromobacter xylosoxidans]|uniref:hypothetical protein n=1 Tax=Alcaligenes xylosoxydans xylosoxydans TaxID=85698 RepID=UPI001EEE340E|nr:hypothetical protein [Achromobacter xylosoxidans]
MKRAGLVLMLSLVAGAAQASGGPTAGYVAQQCKAEAAPGAAPGACRAVISSYLDGYRQGIYRGVIGAFTLDKQNFDSAGAAGAEGFRQRVMPVLAAARKCLEGATPEQIASAYVAYVEANPQVAAKGYDTVLQALIADKYCAG